MTNEYAVTEEDLKGGGGGGADQGGVPGKLGGTHCVRPL